MRAGMGLGVLALAGIILGMTIGFTIVPILVGFNLWGMFISLPAALTKFAVFILFVLAANWAWWRSRLRQQQLQGEVTQARLRLLQGQIEPHLLFNTLANIQSLMDYDPPRAKRMLETFSSYLRASLSQLRQNDSTLEAELDMAGQYLALLQIRMEERLHFRIDASEEARLAVMPALMLQPLVENAVQHGLAPRLDGGSVLIHAVVRAGRLELRVVDDGVGLTAPTRQLRPGAGMALVNLRSRLQTQFANNASLILQEREQGAEAVLELPYLIAAARSKEAV
jgi:sensor histidine kinase YesM